MDKAELLEILAKGPGEWNSWRESNPDVRIALIGADLRRANLRGADLSGADLSGADLSEADLREADLRGANLRRAYLRGAYLREADLREADLGVANLRRAYLRRADLREADLREADLREADLRGAYLRGAYLRGADIRGADLRGAIHGDEKALLDINLPEKEISYLVSERILNASGDLMEAMGFELESEEEEIYGSYYKKIWWVIKEGFTATEAEDLLDEGKLALKAQLNRTAAETSAVMSKAAAELIASLDGVNEAAIKLGTLIIVKTTTDGVSRVVVRDISMALQQEIDRNPNFLHAPDKVIAYLENEAEPEENLKLPESSEDTPVV